MPLCQLVLALISPFGAPRDFDRVILDIRDADYRGDRPALEQLVKETASLLGTQTPQKWVRYWRGFALWREALNGFNDHADPKELESALTRADDEFEKAVAIDGNCVEAKLGEVACLGNLLYLSGGTQDQIKASVVRIVSLLKEAEKAAPANPRVYWVKGPVLWNTPIDRDAREKAAITAYTKALELCDAQPEPRPYEPSWGKPELYMSLAWSNLNRLHPDVAEAERDARAALRLVPRWHYVKDILLPQILKAKKPGGQ